MEVLRGLRREGSRIAFIEPFFYFSGTVGLVKISAINLQSGLDVFVPQDFREGEKILGVVFEPFDCKDVSKKVRIDGLARVFERCFGDKTTYSALG